MLTKIPLMSWREYWVYRFRETRRRLYEGEINKATFPGQAGLVTILIYGDFKNIEPFEKPISRILSQTYQNIELVLVQIGGENLRDDFPPPHDARIRIVSAKVFDGAVRSELYELQGEYFTIISPEHKLKADAIRNMVAVLCQNPKCDVVYLGGPENRLPPRAPFVCRSRVAWTLGGCLNSPSFWQLVNLVVNVGKINPDSHSLLSHSEVTLDVWNDLPEEQAIRLDFYRDFYLSPWVCFLQAGQLSRRSEKILGSLKAAISKAGNLVYDYSEYKAEDFPGSWIPTVFLKVTENHDGINEAIPDLPENSLKVLLNLSKDPLPEQISQVWDLCLAVNKGIRSLSKREKPWRGWVQSPDIRTLLTVLDIRVHAHDLAKIEAARENPSHLKVSVVISTYHREVALREALRSVASQTLSQEDYEVIVVNNDPADKSVLRAVEELRSTLFQLYPGHLRLVPCPLPGLSHARNSGISVAQGEIVCFLDDDALATETWLEQIWDAFSSHPQTGIIGGHIRLKYPHPRPRILKEGLERCWGQLLTYHTDYTEVTDWWEFPWGGNWCARKRVLNEIGGFRSQYGRRKKDFSGGEELIAASLAQRLGYAVALLPGAEVYHQPELSKYTFEYLLKTTTAQIVTNYRIQRDMYLPKTTTLQSSWQELWSLVDKLNNADKIPEKERGNLKLQYICYLFGYSRLFVEQMKDVLTRIVGIL